MLSRQLEDTILARSALSSRWFKSKRHQPPGVPADRSVIADASHAMSNCYRCSRLGAGQQMASDAGTVTLTAAQVAPLRPRGHAGQQFRTARFVQRRKWREGAERSE
jgi:hypothetical protein